MENFQFKESPLDFDHILEENGFKILKDHEEFVVFEKRIKINNEHLDKFKSVHAVIEVLRPKILSKKYRYDIASPYKITLTYSAFPLHSVRRLQWDTFPGNVPDVFEIMLKVAEAESVICARNFMETDIQITQKIRKSD